MHDTTTALVLSDTWHIFYELHILLYISGLHMASVDEDLAVSFGISDPKKREFRFWVSRATG